MLRIISFVLALSTLVSCQHRQHEVTRGFYYWKTRYEITEYEKKTLENLGVRKMYIRLFDVDLPYTPDTTLLYVPVIFITQKTLNNINRNNIEELSDRINKLTAAVCTQWGMRTDEVQIDCDWTSKNKDAYFALLQSLRRRSFFAGKLLSCTIRMHQVKYTVTSGIPPADKGVLMCYNMGTMKKPGTQNSILDNDLAKQYLKQIENYPLKLDIALPLFSWSLLFHEKQFAGIMRGISPEMLTDILLFRKEQENLYRCRKDTVVMGYTLQKNDVIRNEQVSQNALKEIARYTSQRIRNNALNVIFFSCDSIILSKYPPDELEAIYNSYL